MTPALRFPPCDIIAGEPRDLGTGSGPVMMSHNPARPRHVVWRGHSCPDHVDEAVAAARASFPKWRAASLEQRIAALREYQRLATARTGSMAELICDETGKAMWDSLGEAKLLAEKVDITLSESEASGRHRVRDFEIQIADSRKGVCRFRPHGVMAVIGPYNFPAHLPNGHIVPALLMGNTIVFKPSDKTPAVGQMLAELLVEALERTGAPPGVVNLVQGGADVASRLVAHADIDGILFTGSWPVGRRILEANLDRPGRIIALEMGGNNAAVVLADADLKQAAIECARAAFISTGQRCTCTRRIIVERSIARRFVPLLAKVASNLVIGDPRGGSGGDAGHPVFMGPIIRAEARDAVLKFQSDLVRGGGRVVMESTALNLSDGGHFITPGIIAVPGFTLADDPRADCGCDVEVFGPLVRIAECRDLEHAISQANASRFGLAASIFTRDRAAAEGFLGEVRAGCLNVNTGTAGASGRLPFGGLGRSGNHRPAGSFSLDYCAYPTAGLVETGSASVLPPGMRFDDSWIGSIPPSEG